MRKLRIALCGAALFGVIQPACAENPVAQAVQKLHLTAPQLLSLRDHLATFTRGLEIEASGTGVFILRDSGSMGYSGAFTMRANPDGTVEIERVSGPAALDPTRTVKLPFRLDKKTRLQVMTALSGSQLLVRTSSADPSVAIPAATGADSSLPDVAFSGLRLLNANTAAAISQSKAMFFPDGSGHVRSVRAQVTSAAAAAATPLRISDRYYAKVRSDGTQVWRDAVIEIDSDVQIGFAAWQSRYDCPANTACRPRGASPASNGLHLIKWSRQLIASVPPKLLAQIASPPVLQPAQSAVPAGPAATPIGPGSAGFPPTPAPTNPVVPEDSGAPATPPGRDAQPADDISG